MTSPAAPALSLEGEIERVVYSDPDSGYTVARLRTAPGDLVTVVGSLPGAKAGERVRLDGAWEQSPKFGQQFRVASFRSVVPATLEGIEKYLGSGRIHGIGPVFARRLVEKFGLATLEVIGSAPERLTEVGGIGPSRVEAIRKAWEEEVEVRDVMVFLQGLGVGGGFANRIYRRYGRGAVATIQRDPYRLAREVSGIGFRTADRIALSAGLPPEAPSRVQAGVEFALERMAEDGHLYGPRALVEKKAAELLGVPEIDAEPAVEALVREGRLAKEDFGDEAGAALYLPVYHAAERDSALRLARLLRREDRGERERLARGGGEAAIAAVEKQLGIGFAPEQKGAILKALEEPVFIITGGPGTGKTTLVRAILNLFLSRGMEVALAAPTGRAAKRLSEATGAPAKTLHRLLEMDPKAGAFRRDASHPLRLDALIVDELSMVDGVLFQSLLAALPARARLVLVGDADQLPSVGPGNVLRELLASGRVPAVRLREIFRQAAASLIITNAHRILEGRFPILPEPGAREVSDFYFIDEADPAEVEAKIVTLCAQRIPRRFGLDPIDGIQVMSPMHRGTAGATHLNEVLARALNPAGEVLTRGSTSLRRGDKVMQIRNNYDKDVYNGDIGRVVWLGVKEGRARVRFDTGEIDYDTADLDEIVPAYCISVHKSQGAEYPAVVLPILTQHYILLQRNLLYTAVTRGKRLVVLVGTKKALAIALRNDKVERRFTALARRIAAAVPAPAPG